MSKTEYDKENKRIDIFETFLINEQQFKELLDGNTTLLFQVRRQGKKVKDAEKIYIEVEIAKDKGDSEYINDDYDSEEGKGVC